MVKRKWKEMKRKEVVLAYFKIFTRF